MTQMMKCGHSANATTNGKPCCVICAGIDPNALIVDDSPPNLNGRRAKCNCGKIVPSDSSLAFFEHCPSEDFDRYYCGCWGWD